MDEIHKYFQGQWPVAPWKRNFWCHRCQKTLKLKDLDRSVRDYFHEYRPGLHHVVTEREPDE